MPEVRKLPLSAAALVLVLLLLAGLHVQSRYEASLLADMRADVEAQLMPRESTLTTEIYRHTALLDGLAAFALSQPRTADFDASFEIFASGLHAGGTSFRALQAYRPGLPGLIHPARGNEAIAGATLERLLEDPRPAVQADLARALISRQIVLSDPYALTQGGVGLVARRAVYRGDVFWGLVVIVLDMPSVLAAAHLDAAPAGLAFALTDRTGRVFAGQQKVLAENPVVSAVKVPGGVWHLSAAPAEGWGPAVRARMLPLQIAAAVLVVMATLVVYMLFARHDRLARAVSVRTAELAEVHTRYKRLFEHNADAMLVVGGDGRIIEANETACRIYQYHRDELLGLGSADLVAPEVRPLIAERVAGSMGKPLEHDSRHRRQDGSLFEAEVRTVPIVLGGEPCALVAVADVTERMEAERALQESEANLRLVLRSTGEGIFAVDLDGRCTLCNPAAALMLGFHDPAEVVGLDMCEIHHASAEGCSRPRETCWSRRVIAEGVALSGEDEMFRRQDGRTFPAAFRANPVVEKGRVIGVAVSFSDITKRRRTETWLRRLSQAVEQSPIGVAIADVEGRYEYVNPTFARATGHGQAELIGNTPAITDVEGADDGLLAELVTTVGAGRQWRGERRRRRKNGDTFWASIVAAPILGKDRKIDGYVGFSEDVTERRKTAEQFRQAHKMHALGQLTGGVAHDFNNILSVIMTNAEMLTEDLAGDPRGKPVATITRSVHRAAELTERLLSFSRRRELFPEAVDLAAAVREMAHLWRRSLGETIAITVRAEPGVPPVMVDRGELENALLNLAINARDAMPQGGALTVEVAPGRPLVSGLVANGGAAPNFVCVSVRDTGTGMAPEVAERIFEPFFTTKGKRQGTGLGLSLVYGFVRQSGGDIEVDSEEGVGTTFRLYLRAAEEMVPAAAPMAAPRPAGAAGPGDALPALSILLAEDDDAVRSATATMLAACGHSVIQVANGIEGMEILKRTPAIELLLTDIVMPGGMSGRDLADAALRLRPDLKVLFTSGYAAGLLSPREITSGEVAFLPKPYTRDGLIAALRTAWSAGPRPAAQADA